MALGAAAMLRRGAECVTISQDNLPDLSETCHGLDQDQHKERRQGKTRGRVVVPDGSQRVLAPLLDSGPAPAIHF